MSTERTPVAGELIDLGRALTSTHYQLVTRAADFQASDEWQRVAPSAAHWIADSLDVHLGTAREWIRIGHALRTLPTINRAFEEGELNYAKVRTLTRLATPENEAELVPLAMSVSAQGLGRELATWSQRNESDEQRDHRHQRDRKLTWWTQPDGMLTGLFRLPPMVGGRLVAVIEAAVKARAAEPRQAGGERARWPSLGQQRADALAAVVLGGGADLATEVVLHIQGDGCTLDDGTPIPGNVAAAVVPDALIRALIHDADGRPLNASGRRRHPSVRQKRVVKARDRACVDCGSEDLLEYDHNPSFQATQRTTTDELELRCGPCHRRRHDAAA